MLLRACEEVLAEGKVPEKDPAVALISGRIGFASPTDCMSSETWNTLVEMCLRGVDGTIELKENGVQ